VPVPVSLTPAVVMLGMLGMLVLVLRFILESSETMFEFVPASCLCAGA
jgi:hypothetical protein